MKLPSTLLAILLATVSSGLSAADEYADLHPPPKASLPADKNAFYAWENLSEIEWPKDEMEFNAIMDAWNYRKPKPSLETLEKLEDWLHQTQPSVDLIDKGLLRDGFQFPKGYRVDDFKATPLLKWGKCKAAAARLLAERKEYDVAIRQCRDMMRAGQMLEDGCGGRLIILLAARAVQGNGLYVSMRLAARDDISAESVRNLAKHVADYSAGVSNLLWCIKSEFQDFEGSGLMPMHGERRLLRKLQSDGISLYDPEDTRKRYAAGLRTLIRNIHSPWATREPLIPPDLVEFAGNPEVQALLKAWASIREWEDLSEEDKTENEKNLLILKAGVRLHPNIAGRDAVHWVLGFFEAEHIRSVSSRMESRITHVYLHMRAFQLEEKKWPDELADAWAANSPPAALMDSFSGQPLRYSRDRHLVWSVGPDGLDDDGDPKRDMVLDVVDPVRISKPVSSEQKGLPRRIEWK